MNYRDIPQDFNVVNQREQLVLVLIVGWRAERLGNGVRDAEVSDKKVFYGAVGPPRKMMANGAKDLKKIFF